MNTPTYFALGFFFIFMMGGLTGVMLASVPLDLQVHDTFFVVAHFHYVLIGGMVFPLMAAFYHWIPKMTGRMLSEFIGKINFWILFVGFNLTFFPMHQLGFEGMPRRVYTYPVETGWARLNSLATMGAVLLAIGGLVFIGNVIWSMRRGRLAGDNPWDADTLEWATSSPPPTYNFVHPPVVQSRYPMWNRSGDDPVVTGLRTDRREVLSTTILEAAPDHRYVLPGSSIWPLITALAVSFGFIGTVFNVRWAIPATVLTVLALIGWFWPYDDPAHNILEESR
jgi:cytochrome c oxidase subunit 1